MSCGIVEYEGRQRQDTTERRYIYITSESMTVLGSRTLIVWKSFGFSMGGMMMLSFEEDSLEQGLHPSSFENKLHLQIDELDIYLGVTATILMAHLDYFGFN